MSPPGSRVVRQPATSIPDLLAASQTAFSFEFFPPKDDAAEEVLWDSIRRVEAVQPAFISVTYGAGGTTRDRTVRVTSRIEHETSLRTMAHLTCVGSSVAELREVLRAYAGAGIRNVLALRGDPAGGLGQPWTPHPEGLDHAEDLVRLVAESEEFTVGVAAFPDKHPESPSLEHDAEVLVRKADAGASFAITQMVTDVDAYLRLRDLVAASGRAIPIVPGLMPVTAHGQLQRMTALNGQPLAREVIERIEAVKDDKDAVRREGIDIATEHAQRLIDEGAPGVHFITMNRSTATVEVWERLRG
ncbi:methylenetetrahydrofolate reductase [NAD(P)H] [Calidifontibacter sp. DB0510]|uniref:Methylenetetrahydrofolate reductase n=1 Tax=Metallococcus carri TaxID=1656884 RepID=A0A967E9X8_9MICO|nr:methylenetetrahydrofolate reductase [NAD(P)H] [Metallococcus carri]NHN56867.1 methylenetetrahydrofolate reductase [NAD(P)H] [Metallococcus carri]NOP37612.1 methylenetetrahydrofolate reductase [NAD(P)H] [Calidifontibacter sp. DB2511S]